MDDHNPPRDDVVSEQKDRARSGGRPEYKPTDEQRALVRKMVGEDAAKTAIALALGGISRVTLRKHFAAELGEPVPVKEPTLDLAGGHVSQPAPVGRPEYEPTYRDREDVKLCKADGWPDDRIARCLGISRNTLLKHFAEELEIGVDQLRIKALRNLKNASDKGSVPASRELLEMPGMLGIGTHTPRPEPDQVEHKAAPLGKKEQAQRDAESPDRSTEMGGLMARRMATVGVH